MSEGLVSGSYFEEPASVFGGAPDYRSVRSADTRPIHWSQTSQAVTSLGDAVMIDTPPTADAPAVAPAPVTTAEPEAPTPRIPVISRDLAFHTS